MKPVYLICGVSGCGKSWVCRQLSDKFNYVPHDRCWSHPNARPAEGLDPKWGPKGSVSTHLHTLLVQAHKSEKPILTECPFAERQLKEELEKSGVTVVPIFVVEAPHVIAERYLAREGKPLPKAAFSRAFSISGRAREWGAFFGTATEVFQHLKDV